MFFEDSLVSIARMVGRPVPEVKGGKVPREHEGERDWLVVCTLRGDVVPPHSEEL